MGNNAVVTAAGASGNFELNVAKPVIIYNVLQSIRILADGVTVFALRLVRDLDVDRRQLAANVANAPLLATALNPVIGYDKVAMITARALDEAITPREAAMVLGILSGEEYDRHVDPKRMAGL
jgi:fumarate hydratase class II